MYFWESVLRIRFIEGGRTHQNVDGERHYKDGDEEIGQREADNEVVGGRLEAALPVDSQDDKDVAEKGEEWKEDEDESPVVLFGGVSGLGAVGGDAPVARAVGPVEAVVGRERAVHQEAYSVFLHDDVKLRPEKRSQVLGAHRGAGFFPRRRQTQWCLRASWTRA